MMEANNATITKLISSMTDEEMHKLLIRLSYTLTIRARSTYEAGTDLVTDAVLLRKYNEVQHKILGQIIKLEAADSERYPNNIFSSMLVSMLQELNISYKDIDELVHSRQSST